VQMHERVLLAAARGDDVVVAVVLDVAVGTHVDEHVDLLLGETAQLLLRDSERDRRVHEPLSEAGPAVQRLLVVGTRRHGAGGRQEFFRDHEVLVVAHSLVGEDLAVVAGGVRRDLDAVEAAAHEAGDRLVRAPDDVEHMLVLDGVGHAVVVLPADLGEDVVRLPPVVGDVEDVTRLLVDRVAGRAEVAHHGVIAVDGDAGVARREGDRRLDGDEVGIVAEAGAARLLGVDDVLDAEALEEPFGGRFDARVLGTDEATAKEQHAAVDARCVRCLREPLAHELPRGRRRLRYSR